MTSPEIAFDYPEHSDSIKNDRQAVHTAMYQPEAYNVQYTPQQAYPEDKYYQNPTYSHQNVGNWIIRKQAARRCPT